MSNQQMRMSLENSTAIVCESCGNDTFTEAVYIRKISKLLTGSAEDMIAPVPTFACLKCKSINEQFQLIDSKPNSKIIP